MFLVLRYAATLQQAERYLPASSCQSSASRDMEVFWIHS